MIRANALLPTTIEDGLRGRVMSVYSLSSLGPVSSGSLLSAGIADGASALFAVALDAPICPVASVAVAVFVPSVRRLP